MVDNGLPSPKFHDHEVPDGVLVLVNCVSPDGRQAPVKVKLARGMGFMVIDCVVWLVHELFVVTPSPMVYVPAAANT